MWKIMTPIIKNLKIIVYLITISIFLPTEPNDLKLAATLQVALGRSQYSETITSYENAIVQNRPKQNIASMPPIASKPLSTPHLSAPTFSSVNQALSHDQVFNAWANKTTGMPVPRSNGHGPSYYNHQNMVARVNHYPAVYQARNALIKTEVYNAIATLKQCHYVKSDVTVNAQNLAHWLRLPTLKISHPEAHRFLKKTVAEIQKKTMGPDGFYQPLAQEDIQINKAIAQFEKVMVDWMGDRKKSFWQQTYDNVRDAIVLPPMCGSITDDCLYTTDNFITHHAEQLSQLTPAQITEFAQNPAHWKFLDSRLEVYDQELHNKITNSPSYQKLCAVDIACQKGDFAQAANIIPTLPQDFAQHAEKEVYHSYFFEKYTSVGIEKNLINHPDFLKAQADVQPIYDSNGLICIHPLNKELAESAALYQQITQSMHIQNPCESIKNLIYEKVLPIIRDSHHTNPDIKNAVVDAITQNIKELSGIADSQDVTQTSQYQIINRIENAYTAMQTGNVEAKSYLERGLLSGTNHHVLALDYDKQHEFFRAIGLEDEIRQFQSCNNMNTLAHAFYMKDVRKYEFPAHIVQLLKNHNLSVEDYMYLYGNGLQHLIHVDCIKQLDAQYHLQQKITDKALVNLNHLSTQITDHIRVTNTGGDVQQAAVLLNFNWKIINFVKDAGIFCFDLNKEIFSNIGKATLDAARGLGNTIAHPYTSFKDMATGLGHLASSTADLILVIDRTYKEQTANPSTKAQLQKAQELIQQSKQLLSSVTDYAQKEGIPQLAGKAAYTATSFGLDWFITGKSLSLLNKCAKIVKSGEMGQLLQKAANIASKTPELEAVTAEGLKVAVPKAAELCALSEANEIVKNGSRILPTTTTSIENSKELFKFSDAAARHMGEIHRRIPIHIIKDILENPMSVLKDPRGSNALMHYSQLWKDGKLYNVEVLYDKAANKILHFLYRQEALGPLARIK